MVGEPHGGRVPAVTWIAALGKRRSGIQLPIGGREVHFDNGRAWLAGTLYLPATAPPHPAIGRGAALSNQMRGEPVQPVVKGCCWVVLSWLTLTARLAAARR